MASKYGCHNYFFITSQSLMKITSYRTIRSSGRLSRHNRSFICVLHTFCTTCNSRSRMQQQIAACTRAQTLNRTCPCATCIVLLHSAPTSAQDGLDHLQLALVVFSLLSTSTNTPLALMVVITCNLQWWCFSIPTRPFIY